MTRTSADSRPKHMQGNYAPVHEEIQVLALPVEGTIPPELRGNYYRIGPNPRFGDTAHWFFGHGMIHGVQLRDGTAKAYRNRWVRTQLFDEEVARLTPDGTIDLGNTSLTVLAGRVLVLAETSLPIEITRELETIGRYDFGGRLRTWMTAHPKVCPVTGEMHFFGYGFAPPFLTYHRVDPAGTLVQSEVIRVPGPTMIHDFLLTERHVVFMDLPVVFDQARLEAGTMPFRWSDDYGARLGVMPRGGRSGDVRWFEVEPCYVFHTVNAFEDGDRIVIDVVRYPELWRESSNRVGPASWHRWTIDTVSGRVGEEALDDRQEEFPRADERLVGKPYRYGYSIGEAGHGEGSAAGNKVLLKHDLRQGTVVAHDFGPGRVPGEGMFVPASPDAGEDEGFVLTYVYDEHRDTSDFVVLDAHDFTCPALATVPLPQRVPFGFHGSWVADDR